MGEPQAAAAATVCTTAAEGTYVPADPALMQLPAQDAPSDVKGISLGQKAVPLFEIPEKARIGFPTCCLRAKVDVSGIKRKLELGGDRIWGDDEARTSNVAITRPSHDAWGIRKIVFTYCDDFLMRCFEMPWMHDPEWRELLAPVFQAAGIPFNKVVRCLLASMPPGISIPPHHDTGYWVNYTHRLHLPIITSPDHVIFRIGPTVDQMVRINFDEGSLIELNNQSKHAVDNCWDRHRVHLIFDYLEDFAIERIVLKAGDKVNQTRRSIDLATDKGRRPCPSFLILGAQKCGTTSMYEYLTQHPLVLRARRRETHYFDWRWRPQCKTLEEHVDTYSRFFHKSILDDNPSCLSGESTPSYLLHSDIVLPRVKEIAPHAKLIVMLRDPVARAFSQYQMVIDPEGTPEQKAARGTHWVGKTFEQVVQEELEDLKKHGVDETTTPEEFKARYLASRPMGYGSHSLLGRGLYALQLRPWMDTFGPDQLLILCMEDMRTTEGTHEQVDKVFDFLGLPPHRIIDPVAKNTRKYEPMSEATRDLLRKFYAPFNRQLFDLLGRELDWS